MRRPPPPDVIRRAIETAVAGEDEVIAAYVFGSSAHGAAGPLSDVDVAVLTKGSPADDDAIIDRLADRLERTLRVPRVDVVALSRAALPLRDRVIRDGTLIVSRDAARLERFIVESTLYYLDFAPLREHAFRIQRAAILAHGGRAGVLDQPLTEDLRRMARFRNRIVHFYGRVDLPLV